MPTSELSDALNPYISQARSRNSASEYPAPLQPVVQPPQHYVPHRSELELAISEPVPPPPPSNLARSRPTAGGVHAVQELLRIVSVTRESQEIERKRRLAWEQEQEAKYAQRQAEMERWMFEMRQEITSLRRPASTNPSAASGLFTPQYNMSPPIPEQRPHQPASPISPVSQSPSSTRNMFIQGSSNNLLPSYHSSYRDPSLDFRTQQVLQHEGMNTSPPAHSVTPAPSPQLTFVQPSQLHSPEIPASPANSRKRQTPKLSSDEEGADNTSDSSESNNGRPLKRTNHHDTRCLTIHHAIRAHIIRMMGLEHDKELPDSHTEGVPIRPDEPVRFVWDKTAKQSVHNSRMKARVLTDIKAKRRIYKHVPDKDFGKKALEAAFDQSFVTFRQKFKAQRDASAALIYKKREEAKAQKARHLSRRKIKLSNRAEARMDNGAFEHVTFDGALQIECMSSEESDVDTRSASPLRPSGLLRTRGYMWRSRRLVRFYYSLDDSEKADKVTKPKRGIGKKERWPGPPKDGFHLPPKGVASWMISRQWIKSTQIKHPDLPDVLTKLVHDPPGFDWDQFDALGEETDDSTDGIQTMHGRNSLLQPHHNSSTSSLNYALV